MRAILALARIEAALTVRSLLAIGGLLVGAGLVWSVTTHAVPEWWDVGWRLGYGQMLLSSTVLVATQLAAGRVRRDDLSSLYASFPTPTSVRTRAQLLATGGALPASLLLIAAAAAAFELRGAIGTPSPAVLAGGLLLVLAGAAIGVAVGVRAPHPLAGIIAALVWFGAFSQTNRFNGGVGWLPPWSFSGDLAYLPAPLSRYPPAGAHDVELAGIAALAAAVALATTAKGYLERARLLIAAGVAIAAVTVACVVQLRAVPTRTLDELAVSVATPAKVQQCTTTDGAVYCVYPGFGSLLPSFRAPVSAVLSKLPARPPHPLTVRQVADVSFDEPTLTYGHTKQQINRWLTLTRTAPINAAADDALYPVVGQWPTKDGNSAARFDLALGTAEWAVGLPPTSGSQLGELSRQCIAAHQSREVIAIWLAIVAIRPSASSLRAGLPAPGTPGSYALVGNTVLATWTYPGEFARYLASPGPQPTADGFLLAQAMSALPVQRVQRVLDQSWTRWLNPGTSSADLAAALGITRPTMSVPPLIAANPPPGPGQPSCP